MHHIRAKKDDRGMPLWQEQAECRCCRFPLTKFLADTAPGPENGGLIGHDFFNESEILRHRQPGYAFRSLCWRSYALFQTISFVLQGYIFVYILKRVYLQKVLSFVYLIRTSRILRSTMRGNWAIDFGRTCFLPFSFVSFSLMTLSDIFVRVLVPRVDYSRTHNLWAMIAAG